MACQDVADPAVFAQCGIERVDGGARHAERDGNAFSFEHQYRRINGFHLGHRFFPKVGIVNGKMADLTTSVGISRMPGAGRV